MSKNKSRKAGEQTYEPGEKIDMTGSSPSNEDEKSIEPEKRAPACVLCEVPNGLLLQLVGPGHDDGTGARPLRRYGEKVQVGGPAPGTSGHVATEIDADFLDAWLEQNKLNPMVTSGMIRRRD